MRSLISILFFDDSIKFELKLGQFRNESKRIDSFRVDISIEELGKDQKSIYPLIHRVRREFHPLDQSTLTKE